MNIGIGSIGIICYFQNTFPFVSMSRQTDDTALLAKNVLNISWNRCYKV